MSETKYWTIYVQTCGVKRMSSNYIETEQECKAIMFDQLYSWFKLINSWGGEPSLLVFTPNKFQVYDSKNATNNYIISWEYEDYEDEED